MMEEIELTCGMYLLGRVAPGNKPVFLQFEVWVRIEETDTEITRVLCDQQLKDLQLTYLEELDKAADAHVDRFAADYTDILLDELKLAEREDREH
jgi:hypothetical protein